MQVVRRVVAWAARERHVGTLGTAVRLLSMLPPTENLPAAAAQRILRVAVVGFPNAGKSTLVNALTARKVSGVSQRSQTTQSNVLGFVNEGDTQLVLVDTPGITDFRTARAFVRARDHVSGAANAALSSDLVLCLVDGTSVISHQAASLKHVPQMPASGPPQLLVLTKRDLVGDAAVRANVAHFVAASCPLLAPLRGTEAPCWVAAVHGPTGAGVAALRALLLARAVPGAWVMADSAAVSDLTVAQHVADSVREQLLCVLDQEVPYVLRHALQSAVRQPDGSLSVVHTILAHKPSQKGMVVGTRGTRITAITEAARRDLEARLGCPVSLSITVKVLDNFAWLRLKNQE